MNPLHLSFALLPLALYFLWQGIQGLRRHPRVISSTMNTLGISWAIAGLLIVGPLPWLVPEHAVQRFGHWVWLMVLAMYLLVAILWVLLARSQLIVSNARLESIKPLVAEIVARLDSQCTWAGDNVVLPQLGIEFRIDGQAWYRTVTLTSLGRTVNVEAWQTLQREIQAALPGLRTGMHPWTPIWWGLALGILIWQGIATAGIWQQADSGKLVLQALRELLAL